MAIVMISDAQRTPSPSTTTPIQKLRGRRSRQSAVAGSPTSRRPAGHRLSSLVDVGNPKKRSMHSRQDAPARPVEVELRWPSPNIGAAPVATGSRGMIDREDFGITFNAPMEGGGYLIGNTVKIEIELEAVRQTS